MKKVKNLAYWFDVVLWIALGYSIGTLLKVLGVW
jgi:hypothetical protein